MKSESYTLFKATFNSILRTSQPLRSTLITECSIESVDSLDIGTNNDGGENTGINRLKCLDNIKDVFLNCQNFVTKYGLSEGYFNLDQDMDADEEYHRLSVRLKETIKELNLQHDESDQDSHDDESDADRPDSVISLDSVPISKPTNLHPRSK